MRAPPPGASAAKAAIAPCSSAPLRNSTCSRKSPYRTAWVSWATARSKAAGSWLPEPKLSRSSAAKPSPWARASNCWLACSSAALHCACAAGDRVWVCGLAACTSGRGATAAASVAPSWASMAWATAAASNMMRASRAAMRGAVRRVRKGRGARDIGGTSSGDGSVGSALDDDASAHAGDEFGGAAVDGGDHLDRLAHGVDAGTQALHLGGIGLAGLVDRDAHRAAHLDLGQPARGHDELDFQYAVVDDFQQGLAGLNVLLLAHLLLGHPAGKRRGDGALAQLHPDLAHLGAGLADLGLGQVQLLAPG